MLQPLSALQLSTLLGRPWLIAVLTPVVTARCSTGEGSWWSARCSCTRLWCCDTEVTLRSWSPESRLSALAYMAPLVPCTRSRMLLHRRTIRLHSICLVGFFFVSTTGTRRLLTCTYQSRVTTVVYSNEAPGTWYVRAYLWYNLFFCLYTTDTFSPVQPVAVPRSSRRTVRTLT